MSAPIKLSDQVRMQIIQDAIRRALAEFGYANTDMVAAGQETSPEYAAARQNLDKAKQVKDQFAQETIADITKQGPSWWETFDPLAILPRRRLQKPTINKAEGDQLKESMLDPRKKAILAMLRQGGIG